MKNKNKLPRSLSFITLLVSVPREVRPVTEEAKKEEKEIISVAEQMFTTLYAIRKPSLRSMIFGDDFISLEIVTYKSLIHFYIACPRHLKDYIERTVHSQYPKAVVEEAGEYNIFQPNSHVAGASAKYTRKFYLPVKTYKILEADPLNPITNALSKLEEDEGVAIQLIIRPMQRRWSRKGRKIAKKMAMRRQTLEQAEKPFTSRFFGEESAPTFGEFGAEVMEFQKKEGSYFHLAPMQEEMVKAIDEKSSKYGFETNIRVLACAKTKERAEMLLDNIIGAFAQYNNPRLNSFIFVKQTGKKLQKLLSAFIFRYFNERWYWWSKMILGLEELTSIFHLPHKFTETPNIKWVLAKDAPPPHNLPKEGLLLGKCDFRGQTFQVRIQPKDRQRHMYVIGQTGTGKSVFLSNMAIQDIQEGKGVCVVDPHGDLIEAILPNIPKERADDVILFEPFDMSRPQGLNMLEYKSEEQKDFAVQEMIAIFYKLFPPEMIGPMFEHNMRNVMLTLMTDQKNPGTLAEIPRMFTDPSYQKVWVAKLKDPVVRAFWEKEMAKTSDFHKSEMLGYLISKVGRFVENEMMRNIIGQSHSAFDLRKIMDEGKILLVNLSKGKVGEVNSSLLGLIIVSKIQMAAYSRADIPESQRRDFYLYVDEFQNFATDSFASILAEARKYHLNLIVAHQYISQLEEKIRDAVFGNVGTFIAFRIGVEDAEIVAKVFDPVFSEMDVINIARFHAYLRLMIDAGMSKPFTMATYPPFSGGSEEIAEAVRQLSRLKYGRDKRIVETEIMERAALGSRASSTLDMTRERTV
ncbi:MAG: type IV secretory system conjugative DNA transfer family protein [Patescibacteria group bacterium]